MPYEDEIKVLKEMKRVTKPNGHILIVDFNEPRNHWAAKLAFPLIRASESTNWLPFLNRGLTSGSKFKSFQENYLPGSNTNRCHQLLIFAIYVSYAWTNNDPYNEGNRSNDLP